jgi:hypothetical protein
MPVPQPARGPAGRGTGNEHGHQVASGLPCVRGGAGGAVGTHRHHLPLAKVLSRLIDKRCRYSPAKPTAGSLHRFQRGGAPRVQESQRRCIVPDERAGITTNDQESRVGPRAGCAGWLSRDNTRAGLSNVLTNSRLLQHPGDRRVWRASGVGVRRAHRLLLTADRNCSRPLTRTIRVTDTQWQ